MGLKPSEVTPFFLFFSRLVVKNNHNSYQAKLLLINLKLIKLNFKLLLQQLE